MKRIFYFTLGFLIFARLSFSAPSNSISVPNSFSPNTTISSSATNANNNEIQNKYNAHTHTDITTVGAITSGTWSADVIGKSYGGTGNAYGIGLPSGAVFFMISGSCPSGTTDVSATYANKFVKINATAGTSSGTVLTGTTDSHTLTTTEIPAHTHIITMSDDTQGASQPRFTKVDSTGSNRETVSTGGGGGHTHTISSATTLEPSSITMKCCQVN